MIEIEDLRKSFGRTTAVDGISFAVRKGEVLGFLGPNAAGKSTTMRILTCYLPADAGRAVVAGFDTATQPLEVRRRIGYLPENNPLYLDMEVTEFLDFVARMREIPPPRRRERLGEMVEVCGLASVVGRPIGTLSKGYRQRVGLAQSLIHDPEVLVLDEPTTGLDPNQIAEIRDLIRRVGQEKTVILSSHILPEVQATCERILIIHRGKLVGSGTAEELARQARGADTLHLILRVPSGRPEEELGALAGVLEVSVAPEGECCRVSLTVAPGADPREDVFRLAVARGWVILEMHRESASLEDVFHTLTTGENSDG
jgi:ABC-2 type transport system ATP-binding protein